MATIYFTNNFDAGDGTLRAAISSARSGDVIAPASTIADDLIVIELQTTLSVTKSLTFEGGARRVRLDGQKNVRLVSVSNAVTVTFNDYDFVDGDNSSCGGIATTSTTSNLVLNRCFLAGIKNGGTVGDIGSPSSSYRWNDVTVNDSVDCCSSTQFVLTSRVNGTLSINRCTIAGNTTYTSYRSYSNDSLIVSDDSVPKFVSPPTNDAWDADAWRQWDLRLRYDSPYLSGSQGAGTTDILGHARKENAALGAYSGGWLIVSEPNTPIAQDVTCDYLVVDDSCGITFHTDMTILRAGEASFGVDSAAATSNGGSFIVVDGYTGSPTLDNVDIVRYTAGISTARVRLASIEWTADNIDVPILIQKSSSPNGGWTTIANVSGGSYSVSISNGEYVRLYDGQAFYVRMQNSGARYELAEKITVGYINAVTTIGYIN